MLPRMASLVRKKGSKYWFAAYRDLHGRQYRRSTEQTDRKKALLVAQHLELIAQRKLKPSRVHETIADLVQQVYGDEVPTTTMRGFADNWLALKKAEVAPFTLVCYKKSVANFSPTLVKPQTLTFRRFVRRRSQAFATNGCRRCRLEPSIST